MDWFGWLIAVLALGGPFLGAAVGYLLGRRGPRWEPMGAIAEPDLSSFRSRSSTHPGLMVGPRPTRHQP